MSAQTETGRIHLECLEECPYCAEALRNAKAGQIGFSTSDSSFASLGMGIYGQYERVSESFGPGFSEHHAREIVESRPVLCPARMPVPKHTLAKEHDRMYDISEIEELFKIQKG